MRILSGIAATLAAFSLTSASGSYAAAVATVDRIEEGIAVIELYAEGDITMSTAFPSEFPMAIDEGDRLPVVSVVGEILASPNGEVKYLCLPDNSGIYLNDDKTLNAGDLVHVYYVDNDNPIYLGYRN